MPIKVTELRRGDRVMLNCPKAKTAVKRVAEFEAIYDSIEAAMADTNDIMVMETGTAEYLRGGQWASFVFLSLPDQVERGAFLINDDGSLREETGMRVVIERRLGRVQVG